MKKTTPKKSKGTELKKKLDAVIRQLRNAGYDVKQPLFIHTTDDICHMIKSGRYEDAKEMLFKLSAAANACTQYKRKEREVKANPRPKSTQTAIVSALCVLTWTAHIRNYLKTTDPKVLEQAEEALKAALISPACGWDNLP
jgi:hypothetical protein